MHTRSMKLVLFLLLVIDVGCALPAWGQSTSTGSVSGSVTDQSGALVAGATVTLSDSSSSVARTTSTNQAGRYTYEEALAHTTKVHGVTMGKINEWPPEAECKAS